MELVNYTALPAALTVVYDAAGRERLVVAIKVTRSLRDPDRALDEGSPVHAADVLSEAGAVRYPADLALGHGGTDVICLGHVHSPGGRAVTRCRAEVVVGELRASLVAVGARRWERTLGMMSISEPEPFVRVPLGFERAFGGPGNRQNPVGRGDLTGVPPAEQDGAPLPELEREDAPVKRAGDRPAPAGFGAIAPGWEPRVGFAGTYDEAWIRRRAPLLPLDFDERFHRVAAPGLTAERPLRGGEPIALTGLSPEGRIETKLPRAPLGVRVGNTWLSPHLALVVIEPDLDRITLTARASADVTGRVDRVRRVQVLEKQLLTWSAEEG